MAQDVADGILTTSHVVMFDAASSKSSDTIPDQTEHHRLMKLHSA